VAAAIRERLMDDEGNFKTFKSGADMRSKLKDINFKDDAAKAKFYGDLDRASSALGAKDEKTELADVITRLVEFLEKAENLRDSGPGAK
jgi:hypothetical protein